LSPQILVSMGMWGFVHSFPDGYRPQPKITLGAGAVVTRRSRRAPDRADGGGGHAGRGERAHAAGSAVVHRAGRRAHLAGRRARRGLAGGAGARPGRAGVRLGCRGRDSASKACRQARGGRPGDVHERVLAVRAGSVQSRAHALHRPIEKAKPMAVKHVQRLVVARRVRARDRHRQPVHPAEAGPRADEPRDGPDAAARPRAVRPGTRARNSGPP